MKISFQADNTLLLPLAEISEALGELFKNVSFSVLNSNFHIKESYISIPSTVKQLPRNLKKEAKAYDLTILFTTLPYDNNFFYEEHESIIIASVSGWNTLTSLPLANGIFYFFAQLLIEQNEIGLIHYENRGCINDYLIDKRGIDVGMRAASLCSECISSIEQHTQILSDILSLLDLISKASRNGISVFDVRAEQKIASGQNIDLFLCHNSQDKEAIRKINRILISEKLRTWFDEDDLPLGSDWQDEIQNVIPRVRAAGVFVGQSGLGPWQRMEIKGLLSEFVERGTRVIPVILAEAQMIPNLPLFLRQFTWLDLRVNDKVAMKRLVDSLKRQ